MNVLLNLELEDRHIRQIRAVSKDVELVQLESGGEILEAMPDVHVVFGQLSERDVRPCGQAPLGAGNRRRR